MACASCRGLILSAFIKELAGISQSTASRSPATRPAAVAFRRRQIHTDVPRRLQRSSAHAEGTTATDSSASSTAPDDAYLPFDSSVPTEAQEVLSDKYSTPFAGHPPQPPARSNEREKPLKEPFEPEIELQGDLQGVDLGALQQRYGRNFSRPSEVVEDTQTIEVGGAAAGAEQPENGKKASTKSSEKTPAPSRHRKARAKRVGSKDEATLKRSSLDAGDESTSVFEKMDAAESALQHKNKEIAPTSSSAPTKKRLQWQIKKDVMKDRLGSEGWRPQRKLSPDALEGIRALHAQYPDHFTIYTLGRQFQVSPEAISRILRSKWRPTAEEEEDRQARWDRRGEKIWESLVAKGVHPPKKWRMMGIGTGPRRPAQDRSLQQRMRHKEERQRGKLQEMGAGESEGERWLREFGERIG